MSGLSVPERFRALVKEAREALDAERERLDLQEKVLDEVEASIDQLEGSKVEEKPKPKKPRSKAAAPAGSVRQEQILDRLGKAYPKGLRIEELAGEMNQPADAIRVALKSLVDAGEVEKEGKARGVRYSVPGVAKTPPVPKRANVTEISRTKRGHEYPWEGAAA